MAHICTQLKFYNKIHEKINPYPTNIDIHTLRAFLLIPTITLTPIRWEVLWKTCILIKQDKETCTTQ